MPVPARVLSSFLLPQATTPSACADLPPAAATPRRRPGCERGKGQGAAGVVL